MDTMKLPKVKAAHLFNTVFQGFLDRIEQLEKRMEATHCMTAQFELAADVINRAIKMMGNPQHVGYSVDAYSGSVQTRIYLSLNSLKSRKFINFLSYIDDKLPATQSNDWVGEYTVSRQFEFEDKQHSLIVHVSLPADGDHCYRQETGSKMVEQKTYKIVCN